MAATQGECGLQGGNLCHRADFGSDDSASVEVAPRLAFIRCLNSDASASVHDPPKTRGEQSGEQ